MSKKEEVSPHQKRTLLEWVAWGGSAAASVLFTKEILCLAPILVIAVVVIGVRGGLNRWRKSG